MHHVPHLTMVSAVLALAWINCAVAQSSEEEDLALVYGDTHTVSIATGSQQTIRRAPSVASVVTSEEIAAMGATDLDEVMETVPGVHVSRTNTYSSSYVIRGIYGGQINPQVLVLQNGIPLTTLYRGDKGGNWAGQTLENVQRIEVIRGPGSALYGAEAFSGVINIITKTTADTKGVQTGVRTGSYNSRDAWMSQGGNWGDVNVATYLHVGRTDGSKEIVTADAQTARDTAFGTSASLAPGPVSRGYHAIDASADFSHDKWRTRFSYRERSNIGLGAGVSSALDPVGKAHNQRIMADYSWLDSKFAENWAVGYGLSFMKNADTLDVNYQLAPPGSQFTASGTAPTGGSTVFPNGMIGDPDRFERQVRLSTYTIYSGWANQSVRAGLGHDDLNMYETGTHKNYFLTAAGLPIANPADGSVIDYYSIQSHLLPQRRKIDYAYVQDEWNFSRDWVLTAGVRHDRYTDFGGSTNPRLALVWDIDQDLTAKLLYGSAFRAPSFTEQYGINPVANGNPDLKPEKIRTTEAAFSWQAHSNTQFSLSFFHYDMLDVIKAVKNPAPAVGATFQNAGKQHGNGMEIEAVWDATRTIRLDANYAYQKSFDESTGQDAGYAPHHHLYVRADWSYTGDWMLSGQVNRVADRHRAAGDARAPIPNYTTFDLTLHSRRSAQSWDFAASVRNLFDADVREPSLAPGTAIPNDFPMPGRTVWLQLSYDL